MRKLTTDNPVSEMGMCELAYNSCFAKNGEAFYRDFDNEISARNFARELAKNFGYEYSEDDEEFDFEIIDDLPIDKIFKVRELIALFYRNMWAQADLYERLKKYEELGTLEEVCKAVEKQKAKKPLLGGNTDKLTGDIRICPYCCGVVGMDDMRADFCADCGQKLDWSEVEE